MSSFGVLLHIPGRPPSKSNTYRIVKIGGFSRLAKTSEVKEYEAQVAQITAHELHLLKAEPPLFPHPEWVELVVIWHRGKRDKRRKDLDNILKSIKDGLTAGGLWTDDHQVASILVQFQFDAENRDDEWVDIWISPRPTN